MVTSEPESEPEPEREPVTTASLCLCVVASAVQLVNPRTMRWSRQKVITNGKQRWTGAGRVGSAPYATSTNYAWRTNINGNASGRGGSWGAAATVATLTAAPARAEAGADLTWPTKQQCSSNTTINWKSRRSWSRSKRKRKIKRSFKNNKTWLKNFQVRRFCILFADCSALAQAGNHKKAIPY